MKCIVVGDLHGNIELYRKIKKRHNDKYIFLLGDLLDSWIFPIEDQIALVEEVLSDAKGNGVTCLLGNHELSYMIPKMRCSGYDEGKSLLLSPIKRDILKTFKPFDTVDGILLTHAGLNSQFVREYKCGDNLEDILKYLDESWKSEGSILNIGWSRGGRNKCAGTFWSDWNQDFNPVEGIVQICGHTPDKVIRKKGNNWCIDCLPSTNHDHTRIPMGVLIEDGKITEIQLV